MIPTAEGLIIEQFLLGLHERVGLGEDDEHAYCDLCSNHGDIRWPCATVRRLSEARAQWKSMQ